MCSTLQCYPKRRWLGCLGPSLWCLAAEMNYWKELFKKGRPCFVSQFVEL